jgi:hypothetical protein
MCAVLVASLKGSEIDLSHWRAVVMAQPYNSVHQINRGGLRGRIRMGTAPLCPPWLGTVHFYYDIPADG